MSKRSFRQRRAIQVLRDQLIADQGNKCWYCGVTMTRPKQNSSWRSATLDHVIPSSKGDPTDATNCVAACFSCNSAKADQVPAATKEQANLDPQEDLPSRLTRMVGIPYHMLLTETVRRQASQFFGSCPPIAWWRSLADRVLTKDLPCLLVEITARVERRTWQVTFVSVDNVELEMVVRTVVENDPSMSIPFVRFTMLGWRQEWVHKPLSRGQPTS